jgi:hypothetical protein
LHSLAGLTPRLENVSFLTLIDPLSFLDEEEFLFFFSLVGHYVNPDKRSLPAILKLEKRKSL